MSYDDPPIELCPHGRNVEDECPDCDQEAHDDEMRDIRAGIDNSE